MKAAIYNPYLDTMGGGERYTFAVAEVLVRNGYKVSFEWAGENLKKRAKDRFGVDISKYKFVESINRGDGYDLCFWLSDGSIPLLRARKNILHFQVPFHGVGGASLINKTKLFRIKHVVCNSNFTKSVIDKEYRVSSDVVHPPVDIGKFKAKRKENIIIYVGRFSELKQAKRQDVLVEAFGEFSHNHKDWKLVLVGGSEIGAGDYVERLKTKAKKLNVEILEGLGYRELRDVVGRSRIFWSAAGYGIDSSTRPEMVEHFGISVVEAMSAKCVPVVYSAGGHLEIIEDGKNGYLWKKKSSLSSITSRLVNDNKLTRELSSRAFADSQNYSYEKFGENFQKLL